MKRVNQERGFTSLQGVDVDAIRTWLVIAGIAALAGCAANPDPIIDMKGVDLDPNLLLINTNRAEWVYV